MGKIATLIYLEPMQRKALQERSISCKTSLSEEIRKAISAYLEEGITKEDLETLDITSKKAVESIERMIRLLKKVNNRMDKILKAKGLL